LINNRNFFLIILETEKWKIKVPTDSLSGEGSLSASNMSFHGILIWPEAMSFPSFSRALIPLIMIKPS
jgi:hypothetical protein